MKLAEAFGVRTYIPEPRHKHRRLWADKPAAYQHAVDPNRRRMARAKSKRYQRLRSEWCERTFAQVCDTGGMRRSCWKNVEKITKHYLIAVAAHHLGRIVRKLFGIGKPRAPQGQGNLAALVSLVMIVLVWTPVDRVQGCERPPSPPEPRAASPPRKKG